MCNLLQCMWLQTVSIFFPPSKPTPEVLTDYTRKVDFLKGILDAEKLVSIDESCAVTNTVQIVLIVIFSTGEMLYVITVKRKKFRVPFFSSVFNNRESISQSTSCSGTNSHDSQWENACIKDGSHADEGPVYRRDEEWAVGHGKGVGLL